MTEQLTVARPYAKAIFAQAKANDQLHGWLHILKILAKIAKDSQVQQFILNPQLSDDELAEFFYDTSFKLNTTLPEQEGQRLKNFLNLLSKNKRLLILPDILKLYRHFLSEEEGIMRIEVITAHDMDDAEKEALKSVLEKRFASKILTKFKEDDTLIGGMLIRSNNWVLDGTVRGQLNRLAANLKDL